MTGIEIRNVSKNYNNLQALSNVNLTFEKDKIYGLLGRNGAGKSTLLNIITNRIFSHAGEVLIDGEPTQDNDKALKKIYLMSEKNYYPDRMKIKQVFKWTKTFYPDFDEEYALTIAQRFELNVNKTVKSLSTGYSSIFKLIIALSVNTPYVLLDEPVLGLDANHRDLFYRILIEKYSQSPSTIIISTHLIEEVSSVIENIVIIKKGTILKNEPCETLLAGGYTVSGTIPSVDAYIAGRNVIGTDILGGLKVAYLLGEIDDNIPEGIQISKLDLQKLFIQLTNS